MNVERCPSCRILQFLGVFCEEKGKSKHNPLPLWTVGAGPLSS
jgi:hypothetical protein